MPDQSPPFRVHQQSLSIRTDGRGTVEITAAIQQALDASGMQSGTVTVFCQHTSCSLVMMENADPSARQDLHAFMDRLVPEDSPYFVHTMEGPDDMPSHIKMALTNTSEVIPFSRGQLCMGTWQGLFLWEHRNRPHSRQLVLSMQGV